MIKYLTPLDYISWLLITILQVWLWKDSKGIVKFFRFTMVYLLAQSAFQLSVMIFSTSYRSIYYITSILECLLLAGSSVELSSLLVPKFKKLILRLGPLIIAVPTFIIYAIIDVNEIGKDIFIMKSIRISELAFISSLSLLFICIAFEEETAKLRDVSKSYAILLVLLIVCTEIQIRTGITDFIRIIWPFAWLIGLAGICITLRRCRNSGNLNELIKSIEGI